MRPRRPLTSRTRSALALLGLVAGLLCAASTASGAEPLAPFQRDRTPLPASVSNAAVPSEAPDGADPAGQEEDEPAPGGGGTSSGTLVRMVAGLAVVLAVIYGVYWLLRAQRRSKGMHADERIGVLATTTLAPNRTLHLIRVGDELMLVGAAENSISPIRSFSAEEAAAIEQRFGTGTDEEFTPLEADPERPAIRRFAEEMRRRTMRG